MRFSCVSGVTMFGAEALNFVKVQGRILFALLALLAASVSSAQSGTQPGDFVPEKKPMLLEAAWELKTPFKLPTVTVTLTGSVSNPAYHLILANGDVIDIPIINPGDVAGLSRNDLVNIAEETRVILESAGRVFALPQIPTFAVLRGSYGITVAPKVTWLQQHNLVTTEPLAEVLNESPQNDVPVELELPQQLVRKTVRDRVVGVYQFLADALYHSVKRSYRRYRDTKNEMKAEKARFERGFEFILRGDMQAGAGKHSVTRNYPHTYSFGWDRLKHLLVFRKGFRTERMSDGANLLFGGRIEFKKYRMLADEADAADPRPNFSKISGESWYPPSVPVFSPVADSSRTYQSEGFALGASIQNFFLPQTLWLDVPIALLNTSTEWEEVQHVRSVRVPDPKAWIRGLPERIAKAVSLGSTGAVQVRAARCELLFVPAQ